MKYYKFEKLVDSVNPMVKVTFKTWYGKLIIKNVFKDTKQWKYVETGDLVDKQEPIDNFHKNGNKLYWVNGNNI